jgi:hypothetical protein
LEDRQSYGFVNGIFIGVRGKARGRIIRLVIVFLEAEAGEVISVVVYVFGIKTKTEDGRRTEGGMDDSDMF